MAKNWSGAIQISSDGIQNIKSEGYVTKKHQGYGCIDKNTLFKFEVVQGPIPNFGDKVSYEAQRATAASCWNATKVKTIQFAQPQVINKLDNTPSPVQLQQSQQLNVKYPNLYQQQYQQQQQNTIQHSAVRYNNAPPKYTTQQQQQQQQIVQPVTFATGNRQHTFLQGSNQVQQQQQALNVAPPVSYTSNFNNQQMLGQPQKSFSQKPQMYHKQQHSFPNKNAKTSRFDNPNPTNIQERRMNMYSKRRSPGPRKRSYSDSPGRSRSRSPRRTRSRSPRRRRSPRGRYSVKIAKFNLLRKSLDTLELQSQYPHLYIPSDISQVYRHTPSLFANGETIPFNNNVRYHVCKQSQIAAESPAGSSKTYRVKVMLMNGLTKTKLYSNVLAKHHDDKKEHFSKILRFWCNNTDKDITAFGGSWNPKLDGADPENNQTLINTAVRNVKSQIGLDLSYCRTWYKMLEIHYHRLNDKKNCTDHVEKSVIFVPSIWDCQPLQEDWDTLKQKVFEPEPAKSPENSEVKTEAADTQDVIMNEEEIHSPNSSALVDVKCEEMEGGGIDADINPVIETEMDFGAEDIEDLVADDTEDGLDNKMELLTENDIKNMKVTDLRNALEQRGLSIKGLKIQLIARLQKATKEEAESPKAAVPVKRQSSTPKAEPEPTKAQYWKLEPEAQRRMNKLMTRLGIEDREIAELPDLASILLHPAKNVDVSDFSLSSLLDYNKSDKKERVFEVSLFAEVFTEMLQRHFAILLLKAFIEAEGEEEQEKEEKKEKKPDSKRSRKESEKSDTSGRKESESDKKEEKEEKKEEKTERYVHRPDLLLSFFFFDKYRAGYLLEDDILSIIHSIGLNISRSQIKVMIDKVLMGRSRLSYRSLCEKRVEAGGDSSYQTNSIQTETVNLKEIEEVLMLGSANNSVVKIDVVDAPDTERDIETSPVSDTNVVIINGSYIPKPELPDLLSKAMKKVSSLESKCRELEKDNNKLEKRLEESKTVKHSYNDLTQEMGVRKEELDILSTEKIRSELSARKFKLALENAKSSMNKIMSEITTVVEESEKKTENK